MPESVIGSMEPRGRPSGWLAASLAVVVALAALLGGCAKAPGPGAEGSPSATDLGASPTATVAFAAVPSPTLEALPSESAPSASAEPTTVPTPKPTAKPTPRPTPRPTLNPNWTVTATVGNGVLTPSAGTNVDTVTWQVLSAADGAFCEIYLSFQKSDGMNNGNMTDGYTYHAGQANKWVTQLAPDQHDETATVTLACFLGSPTYENKHWAAQRVITIQ